MFLLLTCAQTAIGDLRTSLSLWLVGGMGRCFYSKVYRGEPPTPPPLCTMHAKLISFSAATFGCWGAQAYMKVEIKQKILGINGNLF